MRSLKLFRRADDGRLPLKDRLAGLKARLARISFRPDGGADPQRRVMLAGSLAAAIPLPTLAAEFADRHPDAKLLALRSAFERSREAEAIADEAYVKAWREVLVTLAERPDIITPMPWEIRLGDPPHGWAHFRRRLFRYVPAPNGGDETGCSTSAWTGSGLRAAIDRAVPALGWGGQTPHHIRRWKALLSIADAFDAKVATAETRAGYERCRANREAARAAANQIRTEIARSVATTSEGMAVLVQIAGEYPWKDTGGIWPNLLRSAANVSGVPLASIEHENASTRGN